MISRIFALMLISIAFLPACKPTPKISAVKMEKDLGSATFDFNKDLNGAEIDSARQFVADDAMPAFDALVDGFRNKKYNLFMSPEPAQIDYVEGTAVVQMQFFLGTYTGGTDAKEVQQQKQLWKYETGGWKWHGPISK
jgi:hypothetical protein